MNALDAGARRLLREQAAYAASLIAARRSGIGPEWCAAYGQDVGRLLDALDAAEVEVTASADARERPPAAGLLEVALNQAGAGKVPPVRFLVEGKAYRQSSSVFVVRAVA